MREGVVKEWKGIGSRGIEESKSKGCDMRSDRR